MYWWFYLTFDFILIDCGSRPADEFLGFLVFFSTSLVILNCTDEFRLLRRVTLCLQPQRVTRKGRRYAGAPVEGTGVPIDA